MLPIMLSGLREADPATTYRKYLKIYVDESRKIGAKPILISSVTRRRFDEQGRIKSTLTPWARAAGAVAAELKVPFIDLHSASVRYHDKIGRAASMAFNPKPSDLTHFNRKGAEAITDLIVREMPRAAPALAALLAKPPAPTTKPATR